MKTADEIVAELKTRLLSFEAYAKKSWDKGFESYDTYNAIADEFKSVIDWIEKSDD